MSDKDRRGCCYDLAAKYVLDHAGDESLRLCHGWPVLQGDDEYAGQRYGHAWVERTTTHRLPFENRVHEVEISDCWDTVTGDWWPMALYYKAGNIDESHVAKYSFAEMRDMLLTTKEYGPWVESSYAETAPFHND